MTDWPEALRVVLPDVPMAWMRATPQRGGAFTPPDMRRYKANNAGRIAWAWRQRKPLDMARVELVFFLPRPQRRPADVSAEAWSGTDAVLRAVKPDVDNLAKMVLDMLVEAGVLGDDAAVVSLAAEKRMHAEDRQPGTVIVVRTP